ncbi:MAG: hypothetical protein IAE86_05395 [Burkholderiaceae bacterium]|nr:hypothetical protein [Burkholderiaceae bacterium]
MSFGHFVVAAAMACSSFAATAQFVKGNEAVRVMPDGAKRVETPPLPATGPIRSTRPCAAADNCHGGAWLMVETNDGLVECTEAYARSGTCRASSYGKTKLLRLWVLKSGDAWLQCQLPTLASKCVDMFARPPGNLPYPATQ